MFSTIEDELGFILPMSFGDFPFRPARAFYVGNVPKGTIRGNHAHKACHQLLVCLSGQILCELTKSDGSFESIVLNSPTDALHIPPKIWGKQVYVESNSQLLVFASHEYDETDYIRNWEDFLKST